MDIYIQIFELYGLSFSSIYTDSFERSSLLIIRPTLIKSQSYFGRDEPRDINIDVIFVHENIVPSPSRTARSLVQSLKTPGQFRPEFEFSKSRILGE